MAPLRFMRGSQLVLIWSSYGGRGLHGFLGWEGEPNISKKKGETQSTNTLWESSFEAGKF